MGWMPALTRSNGTSKPTTASTCRCPQSVGGSSRPGWSNPPRRNGQRAATSGSKPHYRTKPGSRTSPTSTWPTAPTPRPSPGSLTTPDTPSTSRPIAVSPGTSFVTPLTKPPKHTGSRRRYSPTTVRNPKGSRLHRSVRRVPGRPESDRDPTRRVGHQPQTHPPQPPDHHRQSRTVPADPQEMDGRPATRRNTRWSSTPGR